MLKHASYHSLHPMHCIGVHDSYVHPCDRSHGARTQGTSGVSTSRDRWLRARPRQAPVNLTEILEAGVLEIVSGAIFLGSSDSVQLCRWLMEGCHVRGPPAWSVRQVYVDWCGKRTCHVGRVFPCKVYIDSNRRDSRIWVTACSWQSSHSYLNDLING
jgi:hypothetical protein